MQTDPECLACFLRQAHLLAQQVTSDPDRQLEAVRIAARHVAECDLTLTPPEQTAIIGRRITDYLGSDNPYAEAKRRYNAMCLAGYPALREHVFTAEDQLDAAVRVAAVGNIMDLSIFAGIDTDAALAAARTTALAINHLPRLAADLATAETVLILGDNAGEIVFDLPLAELLARQAQVFYAVKAGPTSNDVTREDADQVGMGRFATVIDNGTRIMGTPLTRCSAAFLEVFHRADVIISKGQGNFETLNAADANLYFVLRAKCAVVARFLGVSIGDVVLQARRA